MCLGPKYYQVAKNQAHQRNSLASSVSLLQKLIQGKDPSCILPAIPYCVCLAQSASQNSFVVHICLWMLVLTASMRFLHIKQGINVAEEI